MSKFILFLGMCLMSFHASAINVESIKAAVCALNLHEASANGPLLVVGLGNDTYDGTNHNYGADLVLSVTKFAGIENQIVVPEFWRVEHKDTPEEAAEYVEHSEASSPRLDANGLAVHYRVGGRVLIPGKDSPLHGIIFALPSYDINESGHFVSALSEALKLKSSQIVVVVDDLSIEPGRMKLKRGSVSENKDGHNGLKSLNELLGDGSYLRMKMGYRMKAGVSRAEGVLSPMDEDMKAAMLGPAQMPNYVELFQNLRDQLNPSQKARKETELGKITKKIELTSRSNP